MAEKDPTAGSDNTSASALTVSQAAASLLEGFLATGEPEELDEQPKGQPAGEGADDPSPETDDEPAVDPNDNADPDEEPDAPPAPRKHKVKAGDNGEEIEVDEEELKASYLRRQDYTRKTQALAAEKKTAEARDAALATQREEYLARITKLDAALKEATPAEPDWEKLRKTMPAEQLASHYIQWQEHKKKLDAIATEKKTAEAAVQQDQREAVAKLIREENEKLLVMVPEWKEPAKFKAGMTAVAKYAIEVAGFTPEELRGVRDSRVIKLLRTAQQAHAAKLKQPVVRDHREATEKEIQAPTRSATERKPVSETTRSLQSHAKLRSVKSAASAFEKILD